MKVMEWIERHPKTMVWIALMTTLNFVLTLLDAAGLV